MRDDTISKQLKRGNINMLLLGLFLTVFSGAGLILTARTNLNEILGPVTMAPDEVIKIQNPSKLLRYYICTRGSRVSDPVWQERSEAYDRATQKTISTSIINEIQLMQLADKFVMIRRSKSSKDPNIAGALINAPKELDEVAAKLRQDPKLKTQLLPILIDATRFNWGGYFVLFLFTALLIAGISLLRKAVSRLLDKFQNPNLKSLNRFGDAPTVLSEIEKELSNEETVFKCSMLWLTPNWLITSKLTGLEIRSVKELVWIYPQVTRNHVYGVPADKSNSLMICDNRGNYTQVHLPSDDFNYIGDSIRKYAPWAYFGYEPEREQKWHKKTRAAMIAEVEARRIALENK